MAPEAFDLGRFAPPTHTRVTLRPRAEGQPGETYLFPGDPDVDDVARMVRIEDALEHPKDMESFAHALVEGKEMLTLLIKSVEPNRDLSGFKIGPEEMLLILALLVHGGSVAEAVGHAITARNTETGEAPDDEDPSDEDLAALEAGEPGPLLQQASSSSEPSSGSDAAETSALATG